MILVRITENYKEFTAKYINMKKDIKTIKKSQEKMRNIIYKLKNTVEE